MNKFAFTIKEFLVVLTLLIIVGIVTFLIADSNARRQKYHSLFTKNYNFVNRACTRSMSRNGAITYWNWQAPSPVLFKNYFLPYLSIAKKCKNNDANCFAQGKNAYKYINKSPIDKNFNVGQNRYILENGASLRFEILNSRCATYLTPCASILIDTNATLPPNVLGRDLFEFLIYPKTNNIMPKGVYADEYTDGHWLRTSQQKIYENCDEKCHLGKPCGDFCGARLLQDGKMSY